MRELQLSISSGSYLENDLCQVAREARSEASWSNTRISLDGERWNLFPESAEETYISPSNNDCGLVRSPFILEDLKDVVVDGGGGLLMVRGTPLAGNGRVGVIDSPVVPFVIRNCQNVTIRNLSIDWQTPATVQGLCVASGRGYFDVALETDQRVWCWNDMMYLEGEGWTWPVTRLLAVDAETGATLSGTGDNIGLGYEQVWRYEMVEEGIVRVKGPDLPVDVQGAKILFWCSFPDTGARRAPAIFIERSSNVRVEDVTLHYCRAMGVIAQTSSDLFFERLNVLPSGNRKFSLAADGTHFVNCRGKLEFTDCVMQNQLDDAINSHGLYYQIVRKLDARTLRVRTAHPQHVGVEGFVVGDLVRLCKMPYMEEIGKLRLSRIRTLNSETQDFCFDEDLPEGLGEGDMVEDLDASPEIDIRNCTFRWNRARGILINGSKPIRVRDCEFESAGSAIMIESSPLWAEAGPVSDVRIENNSFRNTANCPMWGAAVIEAKPTFREGAPEGLKPFHGKLCVKDNRFENCMGSELSASSFESIESDV
ncbi:right-handed parallel beta-helix repeat-containing protein [Pelagicoccus mobilis]|uniref:Right-handed parallel beta-helix repeat-containing protein n=1 Tax=Pelagicoccus mobilis TaxID=415221 RepID=A0A934VT22_9BACT|nr:right-handed parallel beta-helix repeat-containing protein [Pelagicoccus mobilis]MBK1879079.1 right-handed parallel beta-helix repeat-containing protein [Pelagicoccus mobilis]